VPPHPQCALHVPLEHIALQLVPPHLLHVVYVPLEPIAFQVVPAHLPLAHLVPLEVIAQYLVSKQSVLLEHQVVLLAQTHFLHAVRAPLERIVVTVQQHVLHVPLEHIV
jgi:hypothetical protein